MTRPLLISWPKPACGVEGASPLEPNDSPPKSAILVLQVISGDAVRAWKRSHQPSRPHEFDAATIGALAHLYRGEVYRSTIWRTRLDNTTNWAVVTLGIALSVTFSSQQASPLPLLLAGILCIVFLIFEARRYRYFNVWRARARWMEKNFYAPMLRGESLGPDADWPQVLARGLLSSRVITSPLPAPSGGGYAVITYGSSAFRRSPITVRSRSTRCRYLVCPSWWNVPVLGPSRAS